MYTVWNSPFEIEILFTLLLVLGSKAMNNGGPSSLGLLGKARC